MLTKQDFQCGTKRDTTENSNDLAFEANDKIDQVPFTCMHIIIFSNRDYTLHSRHSVYTSLAPMPLQHKRWEKALACKVVKCC